MLLSRYLITQGTQQCWEHSHGGHFSALSFPEIFPPPASSSAILPTSPGGRVAANSFLLYLIHPLCEIT